MTTWQQIQADSDPSGAPGAATVNVNMGTAAPAVGDLAGAIQARFGADTALKNWLGKRADLEREHEATAAERQALAEALKVLQEPPPPEREYPPMGGTGAEATSWWEEHFGRTNQAYLDWQKRTEEAHTTVDRYLEGYEPGQREGKPTALYKELQAAEKQYTSSLATIDREISNRQQELTDAVTKTPSAPTVTQVPVPGKPGWTQPSVFDQSLNGGKGGYRPATGPDGQPLPQVPPAAEVTASITRAGKPKQGDTTWEPKQSGNKWFQVPMVADAQGNWQYDTSRQPQEITALRGAANVQVIGNVPYVVGENGQLTPAPGYAKPPIVTTDEKTGRKYYSTDDGKTWQAAQGLPNRPQTITNNGYLIPLDEEGMPLLDKAVRLPEGERTEVQDGYLIRYDPNTKAVDRVDLYTPEQRARFEETAQLGLETSRANLQKAQALPDPTAEYQRQVGVAQQQATTYRDDLNQQVLEGRLSVEDASTQFDDWWDRNVEAKLSPYRTMAEASYRKEQNDYLQKQAAEQARVDAINRSREQVGYQAGETARNQLNALAPQARSPEFLDQLAQNVSRIGQPLPGGVTQHSGGMAFSPESLSLANVRRAMPNLTEVGQNAAARALAQISPAAAQSVGAPPPPVPSLPDVQGFMNTAPFQIPNPALPVPGQEALDLGNPANAGRLGLPVQPGFAGTRMQGGQVLPPWQLPLAGSAA